MEIAHVEIPTSNSLFQPSRSLCHVPLLCFHSPYGLLDFLSFLLHLPLVLSHVALVLFLRAALPLLCLSLTLFLLCSKLLHVFLVSFLSLFQLLLQPFLLGLLLLL